MGLDFLSDKLRVELASRVKRVTESNDFYEQHDVLSFHGVISKGHSLSE